MKKSRTKRSSPSGDMIFKGDVQVTNGSIIRGNQIIRNVIHGNVIVQGQYDQDLAETRPKKRIPRLLTYQMNRVHQEKRLRELFTLYKSESPLPIVTFVHGDEDQALDMFMERLREDFIPKQLLKASRSRAKPEHVPIYNLAITQSMEELQERLQEGLAKELVVKKGAASLEKIQKRLASSSSPAIVEILLSEEFLMSHKTNVLQAMLNFWDRWPALSPGQVLFVFIYFAYQKQSGSAWQNKFKSLLGMNPKAQISSTLAEFPFQRYSKTISGVLPELTDVPKFETELWANQEARKYYKDTEDLLSLIRRFYAGESAKPMYLVASALRAVLETS